MDFLCSPLVENPPDELVLLGFGYLSPYRVAGMAEPGREGIQATLALLARRGIGAVLTLTEDDLLARFYLSAGFAHAHVPVDDGGAPSFAEMDRAMDFIQTNLARGRGVAVHCLEGRGRTGLVLGAFLAREEGLGWPRVFQRLKEARPSTVLNDAQRRFLAAYLDSMPTAERPRYFP
ncbi:MAG: dual specificity protein phosphatase family protein [Deltaproteobacteria bacterium]|nr:dual specificity protein phosphatase family protein [Deltaproteobacteria bacterium]